MSKHQDDQGLGVYAQGEGFPKDSASSIWRVSAPRHQVLHCSELPFCLMPTLEGGAPHRFLARCLNIKATGGLSLSPGEEASRRNPLTPAQGQDARILTGLYLPFALDAHARRVRPPPLPFGVSKRSRRFGAWCPRPEETFAPLLLRCLKTKVTGLFLTEPHHSFSAFLYIVIKT